MDAIRLTDLIVGDILQKMQDSFAAALRLRVLTRDAAGRAVTRPSEPTPIAELIDCATLREECGSPLTPEEGKAWLDSGDGPLALVRVVEPIGVEGACLGSIEITVLLARGDAPPACLNRLPRDTGPSPEELRTLFRARARWSTDRLDTVHDMLRSIAGLLSDMCQRGYDSNRRMRELSSLYEVSTMLTRTMDLQQRLDILTRVTTRTLGVKGCLIRLLDEANGELLVKSVYNLSQRYLEKGPVNLADSAVDQEAIAGHTITIPDVTRDPRTLYPRETAAEGLVSSLCVSLRSRGHVIGTIRVYTGQPHEFTPDEVRLFQAIANQAAVAIENATFYDQALRAQALDKELAVAAQVQRHLLPDTAPKIPGFDIASRYVPFEQVGGDFFDFVPIQDRHLGIAIADVSGKGVPGAILMAATRAVLRGHIETVYKARDIVTQANRSLCRDIAEEQFVTLFYGALDTMTNRFTYCNAGHSPPLIFRDNQHCELVEGGLILGVDPDFDYEESQFHLRRADVLLLYTDGLTETMDPDYATFGRQRLLDAVAGHLAEPAEQILDRVWHAVRDFARGTPPRDDFTIIVLKVL